MHKTDYIYTTSTKTSTVTVKMFPDITAWNAPSYTSSINDNHCMTGNVKTEDVHI